VYIDYVPCIFRDLFVHTCTYSDSSNSFTMHIEL